MRPWKTRNPGGAERPHRHQARGDPRRGRRGDLKPYDEQTAAGAMPFAIVGGQALPLASAVTRLRAEAPELAALFDANGKLDIPRLTPRPVPRDQGNQRADPARPGAEAVTPSLSSAPPREPGRARGFLLVADPQNAGNLPMKRITPIRATN